MTVSETAPAYKATQEAAAYCDLTDWAILKIEGPDAKDFLQGQASADIKELTPEKALPACLLTAKGKIVGVLQFIDRGGHILILCEKIVKENVLRTLSLALQLTDSKLEDVSGALTARYFKGPNTNVESIKFEAFGIGGFLVIETKDAPKPDLPEIDDETLKILRVEAGVPAFGKDMDGSVFPPEARLDGSISYSKGCFLGQETIAYLKNRGRLNREIVGIKAAEKLAPGTDLFAGEEKAGRITSVVFSPRLGAYLALAMVKFKHTEPGTRLKAGDHDVEVIELPL